MDRQSSDYYPKVVSIPPDKSVLWLDSRFRGKSEKPTDFSSTLSSGVVAKELIYKNLYWTMPLFTHNLTNNEIRFQVQGNDLGPNSQVFVAYIRPWVTFTQFDGNAAGGGPYNPPQTGSYGKEVEVAFADARLLESNYIPVTITVGGNNITFSCLYNPSVGYLISCSDDVTGLPVNWRFADCNWISEGFNIHGFGIYDQTTQFMRPKYADNDEFFYQGYTSDSIPNLTLSKYFVIFSEQLTRERRLQSFKNYSDGTGTGNDLYNNEIATIPVLLSKVGKYNLHSVSDGTVVSVREGSETQFARVFMLDNASRVVECANPLRNFLQDTLTPASIGQVVFDSAQNYRSSVMMDYLLFGNPIPNNATIINQNFVFPDREITTMTINNLVGDGAIPSAKVDHFNSVPPAFDMTGPWLSFNTALFTKMFNGSCVLDVSITIEVVASTINAGTTAGILFDWRDFYGNFLNPPYDIQEYKSLIPFPVDAAAAGSTFTITDTLPLYFLDQMPSRNNPNQQVPLHPGQFQAFIEPYIIAAPVPDGGQSATLRFGNALTAATSFYRFTSINSNVLNGYLNPALNRSYGDPSALSLCDDLVHEIDVVY